MKKKTNIIFGRILLLLSEDEGAYDEVEDIIKEKLGLLPKTVIGVFGL